MLVSASYDGTMRVWHLPKPHSVLTITAPGPWCITCLAAKGVELVAAGCANGQIKLWRVETGTNEGEGTGHTDGIVDIATIKTDTVASSSMDCTIRLWSVVQRAGKWQCDPLEVIDGLLDVPLCLHPTPSVLACGSADGVVRVYALSTMRLLHVAVCDGADTLRLL